MSESTVNRFGEIDLLRGLAIAGMIAEGHHGEFTLAQFRHGSWFDCTAADAVYPLFLFVSGVALQISYDRQIRRGETFKTFGLRVLWRALKLFLIGLFLLSVSNGAPRFGLGTLQCIALASVIAAPAVRLSRRGGLFAVIGIGIVHTLILLGGWPGGSAAAGHWTEGRTIAEAIDLMLLDKPRGMEGVLATVMAGAMMIFGTVIGKALYGAGTLRPLSGLKLGLLGAGMISGAKLIASPAISNSTFWLPIVPDLFSFSYLIFCSGIAVLLLLTFRTISKYKICSIVLSPLQTMGLNALGLFVFIKLLNVFILKGLMFNSSGAQIPLKGVIITMFTEKIGLLAGSLFYTVFILSIGWLFCRLLEKRGIIIKL